MTKIHLYGEDFEVFDAETLVPVGKGELLVANAKAFILQTPDRKQAHVVFLGSGGEAYLGGHNLPRVDPNLEEHLKAYAFVTEPPKAGK